MMKSKKIYSVERTFQGAWAIHGIIGLRQYMGYTRKEARQKYLAEVAERRVEYQGVVFYVQ